MTSRVGVPLYTVLFVCFGCRPFGLSGYMWLAMRWFFWSMADWRWQDCVHLILITAWLVAHYIYSEYGIISNAKGFSIVPYLQIINDIELEYVVDTLIPIIPLKKQFSWNSLVWSNAWGWIQQLLHNGVCR